MKDTKTYNDLIGLLRELMTKKGWVEVPTQSRLSILAACENPHSVKTFDYGGQVWPLPQTGQMWLERELLQNDYKGVYCISTSYREEKDPIPGRHEMIFPMFEFEGRGGIKELFRLEEDILQHLGFDTLKSDIGYYDELAKQFGTSIIEDEHETRIWKEISPIFHLTKFPLRTHPFWNMKHLGNGIYEKVDVILFGQETIGSAVRSTNVEEMRNNFYTIENGKYAEKLFSLFGKDRVVAELEDFLSLPMSDRFGGGIGMTRLARAYKLTHNIV